MVRCHTLLGMLCALLSLTVTSETIANEAVTKTSSLPCTSCAHTSGKRPGDQIWVVSTRHLGCQGVTEELPDYRVQYFAQGNWHRADTEQFLLRDDPARPTVIFIHGNRYTASDAIESGWEAYHALLRCASPGPIRFVIWSWPSDKQGGPIRDARSKACRTLVEGYYLGRLLTRISPDVPTGMIGYSYGSRVALGAVHLAAGGMLDGRVVPDLPSDRTALYRIAMLAPGVEDDGLLPGARFEMALARTERLLNLYNPADPVLKRYRVVNKFEKPIAMGYSGIACEHLLGPAAGRIVECNVSGIVGRSHDEDHYFGSESVMQQVRRIVLGPAAAEEIVRPLASN